MCFLTPPTSQLNSLTHSIIEITPSSIIHALELHPEVNNHITNSYHFLFFSYDIKFAFSDLSEHPIYVQLLTFNGSNQSLVEF